MPELKLHYFHARGRGEPARLCFAAGGVAYEDIRYTNEEWAEKKKGKTIINISGHCSYTRGLWRYQNRRFFWRRSNEKKIVLTGRAQSAPAGSSHCLSLSSFYLFEIFSPAFLL